MKYDTIIIGGGLSGLVAGIALAKQNKRVAIVSLGQSALHFSSGSFGLFGTDADGKAVEDPFSALACLPASHPYAMLGADRVKELASTVKDFFAEAGISLRGENYRNSERLTPTGDFRRCWLTLDDFPTRDDLGKYKNVAIVSVLSYLDFYPDFIAASLKKIGIESSVSYVTTAEIDRLRKSVAEMRATSLGRQLHGRALDDFAAAVAKAAGDADAILIPAVVGMDTDEPLRQLREKVGKPLYCVATTPMSVVGQRMQTQLRRRFERLGGTYMLGDTVSEGRISDAGELEYVRTVNFGEEKLVADNYILATGSFFSRGVVAEPHRIYDPVFDLDVDVDGDRDKWFERNIFNEQPYMKFGVAVDKDFHPRKGGRTVKNLYAVGAVIGGHNALKEGSGAATSILTAMHVADIIQKNK